MSLENPLGDIQPDCANLFHGRSPFKWFLTTTLWHIDAVGGRPPHQITAWKAQLAEGAAGLFGGAPGAEAAPVVDLKSLHAKIGELTLENDFLSGALSKAGLLSAKR
jgi:hypothetical protein